LDLGCVLDPAVHCSDSVLGSFVLFLFLMVSELLPVVLEFLLLLLILGTKSGIIFLVNDFYKNGGSSFVFSKRRGLLFDFNFN
jgi:hypothetical protein